jgi:hypothetical protein
LFTSVVVIWRKSKKINGVDSDSEIGEAMTDTPPDIADEASAAAPAINGKKEFIIGLVTVFLLNIEPASTNLINSLSYA